METQHSSSISLFVWLWLVVNDRKFPAKTVFFSHTNQPAVLLHKPEMKRTSQPKLIEGSTEVWATKVCTKTGTGYSKTSDVPILQFKTKLAVWYADKLQTLEIWKQSKCRKFPQISERISWNRTPAWAWSISSVRTFLWRIVESVSNWTMGILCATPASIAFQQATVSAIRASCTSISLQLTSGYSRMH